jgi:hypothetical protein
MAADAGIICQQYQRMYEVRGNFNTLWQTVSERVMPNYSDFTQKWSEGQRKTNRVFDSTAPQALVHGVAALESILCPASARWHRVVPRNAKLKMDIQTMIWCDQVTDCLFDARYAPSANFQNQIGECLKQLMCFGNGPWMVDDVMGYGLRYRCLNLAEVFGMENAAGVIDTICRVFTLTASAAMDAAMRGILDKDKLPTEILEQAKANSTQSHEYLQMICPNDDRNPRAKDYTGMAFSSCIVLKEKKTLVHESGYHTQPIMIARYNVNSRETYGRGPGVDVLPEILALNEMEKSDIRQTQRAAEPPLLLADDGSLGAFDLRGNSMNYGTLSPDGKPLVVPFTSGSNFEVTEKKLEQKRQMVCRAFLNDIFSMLIERPGMTATEVLQRAQEQGYLIAPIIGRIQSELFGPTITREIDILHRAGALPPPPDAVKRMGGIEFDIVYEGQVQVMQRQGKALAIAQTFQQAAPLIQADPTVLKQINMARTFKNLFDFNGAPADVMNTDEEMQAKDAAEAQQQQLTNMAQIAGPASAAIKNLAQAQQASGAPAPGNVLSGA